MPTRERSANSRSVNGISMNDKGGKKMNDANPKSDPTRRDVIAGAAAVGVAAGIAPFAGAARAQSGKPPHVLIVGAGLAGLCTAYLLQKEGWTCTILEAERNHVGGRVRTMPIGNGLYWEAGAMRIPDNHKITLKYVNEFRLELRQFILDTRAYFARGRKELDEAKIRDVYRLASGEKDKLSKDLWELSVHGPRDRLTPQEKEELNSANTFTSAALKNLDSVSLRQLIEQARLAGEPLSEEAIEYLLFGYGNLTLQHSAATEFLREELNNVWDPPFHQIVGGNERLPKAFQARLRSAPKMGCEVIALEQDASSNRVAAVYRTGSTVQREWGDFVVCTVPLSVLPRIERAVPGRKTTGHSRFLVRARDQDRRPHQAPILGDGGRLLRRHHIHRPDNRLDLLSVRQSHPRIRPFPAGRAC